MNKHWLLHALFLLIPFFSRSQSLQWATRTGSDSGEFVTGLTADGLENSYITGYFKGAIDFDPGPGIFNMTPFGLSDLFVRKLDPSAGFLWAKQVGGANAIMSPYSMVTDPAGATVICGHFWGTVDFDPGPGIFNLVSTNTSAFVLKLNASGDLVWAKAIVDNFQSTGRGVAVDNSGNVYLSGEFYSTADFDPGPGTYNLSVAASGYCETYITKLDAAGNFVWAEKLDCTSGSASSSDIAIDNSSNIYLTGQYGDSVDFDPGPGLFYLSQPGTNQYVLKLDAAGGFVWVKDLVVSGGSAVSLPTLAVTGSGVVYSTGEFSGTVDFDPGIAVFNLTAVGYLEAYVFRLDASGNFSWAVQFMGTNSNSAALGNCIVADPWGNSFVYGQFQKTVDFNPGTGTFNMTANYDDAFLVKLDVNGNLIKAFQTGGNGDVIGNCAALTINGNLYTAGDFVGTVDFDPGSPVYNLTSLPGGWPDIYLRKFANALSVEESLTSDPGLQLFPDPFVQEFSLLTTEKGELLLYDASGRLVYTALVREGSNCIDPGAIAAGSYQAVIRTKNFMTTRAVIKR